MDNEIIKSGKKKLLRRLPWLGLIPLGFVLPAIARSSPWAVEKLYSSGIYPYIHKAIGGTTGGIPFSCAEFFVCGVILGAAVYLISAIYRLIIKKISLIRFASLMLSLCIFGGVLFNLFYLSWGFNYSRPSLGSLMDLDTRPRDTEELQQLSISLILAAKEIRREVPVDENGLYTVADYRAEFKKIPAAYNKLSAKHPIFKGPAYPAKGVLMSEGMSWAGISGIYMPYTGEANVNVHQHPLLLLSSAAHETAHSLGFAREDEANFIAYLACINSDDPSVAYSGIMLAVINCTNRLFEADPELYMPLRELYSEDMLRDLYAYNAYWDGYEGKVEETVNNINDTYLKFNKQEQGVRSYGMMVDLLLAYYGE